jgi:hypothetical protein
MENYLDDVGKRLIVVEPSFSYNIGSFANRDGSADAELVISGLTGDDWKKLFIFDGTMGIGRVLMQEVLPELSDFWISTFMLFEHESFDDVLEMRKTYEGFRGMLAQGTYHYEVDYSSIDKMIRAVQAILGGNAALSIPGFIDTYGVPPSKIMIRLSWNPLNANPLVYK